MTSLPIWSKSAGGREERHVSGCWRRGHVVLGCGPAHSPGPPQGTARGHGKELGASQRGDKGHRQIRRVIAGLRREQLVSSQNFRSRLWPRGFHVFPEWILIPAVALGSPKGCPGRWAAGWPCSHQELLQAFTGLVNTQPQLVASSQVFLAAVKPSDHVTSPTGVGLILAWWWRWKMSCLFSAQLHSDLVMISSVLLEI